MPGQKFALGSLGMEAIVLDSFQYVLKWVSEGRQKGHLSLLWYNLIKPPSLHLPGLFSA